MGFIYFVGLKCTGSHWFMWSNVKFRIGLPKTNSGLAKSHLQWKTRGHAKKTAPDKSLGVFWPNIAKFEVYLRYRHCSKLFREMGKESEFRQRCCRNSTKVWERKRKSGREKILNFGNHITKIPTVQTCWPKTNCGNAIVEIGEKKNLWQLWQCHCQKWGEKNK